jgi:release factor glutamine methyltransferase
MAQLAPEVHLHDPVLALTPGGDGLSPYRVIAMQAARYLSPQGRVIVEIGWAQGPATMEIFAKAGWQDLRLIPDLEGRDRVILAQTFADPAEKTRN